MEINIHSNEWEQAKYKKKRRTRFKYQNYSCCAVSSNFITSTFFLVCLIVCELRTRWKTSWIKRIRDMNELQKNLKKRIFECWLWWKKSKKNGSITTVLWITNKFWMSISECFFCPFHRHRLVLSFNFECKQVIFKRDRQKAIIFSLCIFFRLPWSVRLFNRFTGR